MRIATDRATRSRHRDGNTTIGRLMGPAGPDDVPEVRLAAIGEVLRDAVETGLTANQACRPAEQLRAQPEPPVPEPVPTFAGANTLSAEPDLAQRVEEILRTQPPGTACVIPVDTGRHYERTQNRIAGLASKGAADDSRAGPVRTGPGLAQSFADRGTSPGPAAARAEVVLRLASVRWLNNKLSWWSGPPRRQRHADLLGSRRARRGGSLGRSAASTMDSPSAKVALANRNTSIDE